VRDWLYVAFCGAGRGARDRFDELAYRWRRRALGRLRGFVAVLLPVLLVAELLDRHFGAWTLGLVTGAVVAIFMSLRDEAPAYIEAWRSGYEGERKTARVLAPLRRSECVLFHDLPDRRTERHMEGNVDHVVVAPWGVFLLDSKMLGGSANVEGDVVRVQRLDDETDEYSLDRLASGMRGKAVRLKEDIEVTASVKVNVTAVVVLWCPFEAGAVTINRVTYVGGDKLANWIRDSRRKAAPAGLMDAERVARIASGINRARPPKDRPWWRELQTRAGLRQHHSHDDGRMDGAASTEPRASLRAS